MVPGSYILAAEKAGYKDQLKVVNLKSGDRQSLVITLYRPGEIEAGNVWLFWLLPVVISIMIIVFLLIALRRRRSKKECPECGALMPKRSILCPGCGYDFIRKTKLPIASKKGEAVVKVPSKTEEGPVTPSPGRGVAAIERKDIEICEEEDPSPKGALQGKGILTGKGATKQDERKGEADKKMKWTGKKEDVEISEEVQPLRKRVGPEEKPSPIKRMEEITGTRKRALERMRKRKEKKE
jgi:ribosomal protein L40E